MIISNFTKHICSEKEGLYPDEVTPQDKPATDYENLWEKYWNMDPENFIWGIDPNEAPPEV